MMAKTEWTPMQAEKKRRRRWSPEDMGARKICLVVMGERRDGWAQIDRLSGGASDYFTVKRGHRFDDIGKR
jgi:hypothetical protein